MKILINTLPNNQYVEIPVEISVINFYVETLHNYNFLSVHTGLEKVAQQIISNLYDELYIPCYNALAFDTPYVDENYLDDFDNLFSFIKYDIYDHLGDKEKFNGEYFVKTVEKQINDFFVRIKTNRVKKAVYKEIQQNDTFILDHKELEKVAKNSNDETIHKIAKLIIDAPFTQLLSYFYFYEEKHIDYNLKNVFSIVKDIRSLITEKPFYDRLCSVIKYELVNTCNIK